MAEDWKCGRCGESAYDHSQNDSTCIWDPIPNEPTVQVPESLIERIKTVMREVVDAEGTIDYEESNRAAGAAEVEAAVLALLSQPTPTAEPDVFHADVLFAVPAPPSIADMAPGTILRARMKGSYIDRTLVATGRWYTDALTRILVSPDDIDPSTIRDVTPPKQ